MWRLGGGGAGESGRVRKSLETTLKHGPTMAKSLLGACLVYVCMSSCCHKFLRSRDPHFAQAMEVLCKVVDARLNILLSWIFVYECVCVCECV